MIIDWCLGLDGLMIQARHCNLLPVPKPITVLMASEVTSQGPLTSFCLLVHFDVSKISGRREVTSVKKKTVEITSVKQKQVETSNYPSYLRNRWATRNMGLRFCCVSLRNRLRRFFQRRWHACSLTSNAGWLPWNQRCQVTNSSPWCGKSWLILRGPQLPTQKWKTLVAVDVQSSGCRSSRCLFASNSSYWFAAPAPKIRETKLLCRTWKSQSSS